MSKKELNKKDEDKIICLVEKHLMEKNVPLTSRQIINSLKFKDIHLDMNPTSLTNILHKSQKLESKRMPYGKSKSRRYRNIWKYKK